MFAFIFIFYNNTIYSAFLTLGLFFYCTPLLSENCQVSLYVSLFFPLLNHITFLIFSHRHTHNFVSYFLVWVYIFTL